MKETLGPDAHDNIQEDLNWLEALARKIPGFKGYLNKRDRREADQMLRETLAGRFNEVRLQFGRIQETLSADIIKAIDFSEPFGRVDNRLMGLIGKIKDAPQGYAGFFDATKVDEERLNELYQFDRQMMAHGEQIALDVQALAAAVDDDGDINAALRALDKAVRAANDAFAARNDLMKGMA